MGKFGRLLFGTAVLGAAAAGAYEYLKESGKLPSLAGKAAAESEGEPAENEAAGEVFESADTTESIESIEEDETTKAAAEESASENAAVETEAAEEETTEEGCASEEKLTEEEPVKEKNDVEKAVDDFAGEAWEFAKRTYTTVKTGAIDLKGRVDTDVMPKVKEAIGPKGTEILNTVGETAGKFKDVTIDSAKKIHGIVKEDQEKHYSTVEPAEAPDEEASAAEEAPVEAAAETVEAPVEETPAAEEAPAEAAAKTVEAPVEEAPVAEEAVAKEEPASEEQE